MKNNKYQKAVSHLQFSDDLYKKVAIQSAQMTQTRRPVRAASLMAAVITIVALLATTASGITYYVRENRSKEEIQIPVQTVGTQADNFSDAKTMEFTMSPGINGVTTRYLELELGEGIVQYQFVSGMLYNWAGKYYRITEDARLEEVTFSPAHGNVQKGESVYTVYKPYGYMVTENGVVSAYHGPLQVNENGEVLINVYCIQQKNSEIGDAAWPAYLNVETGELRDALPLLSADNFEGRVTYTRRLKDGILIYTLVDEQTPNAYNLAYWVNERTSEIVPISTPGKGDLTVYQDELYYQDQEGLLYRMDEDCNFLSVSKYRTPAFLSGGLLRVMTDKNTLGIFDVETGYTYVFDQIPITYNELQGDAYLTMRKGNKIALITMETNWELKARQITQVGILDLETRELKLLELNNELEALHCTWLTDHSLAIIYGEGEQQYLCIYEFE